MLEGVIQEAVTIVNVEASNRTTLSFIKQMLMDLMGDKTTSAIILEDFNTPLQRMHRPDKSSMNNI